MRATEFINESQEIHNRPKLDSVLGRCIELLHDKRQANPGKYGKVAACIIDHKNRKVFGINSPGADGTRRHAERVAIDTYHKRYGKILPGAIIVTTLSPCNRDMVERDGPSCQDLLTQVGIEKVYSGYMDPSQHSDHPFTEEVTKNDELWQRCKELSDSFVHDDLSESQHHTIDANTVLGYVKRTHAPDEFNIEYSITDHPEWELTNIPLSQLNLDPDGKTQDPYNRVNWVDDDKVQGLISRIGSVLKSNPIVVDTRGWIIDGNHRAIAAVEAGLTIVPALVPVKQGVTEGLDQITEYRNRLLQYVKSLLPAWPEYVLKDWLVPNKGNFSNLPADAIKNGIMEKVQGAGLTPSSKWQLVPNMKFTMDMFEPMTKQRLIGRAGGHSDMGLDVPRDKERHATQAALAQQQGGVRKEPVLLIKSANGYELLEGWHRTIQHFVKYPDGYTGPAYITVAQGQQGVAENFADGRNPQDKGDSKRHGVPTKASVSTLRKVAKQGGRKGQLAHWMANMKAGRAKAKKK